MADQDQKNDSSSGKDVRAEWQELDFEKISAQDAEATFTGIGGDGGFYS